MTADVADRFLRRWWEDVWRNGQVGVVDELFAEPFVQHTARGSRVISRAEFKRLLSQYQRVVHGAATTVDDRSVDGDKLWIRATSRGVNLETTAPAVVSWMACYRFENDLVVEGWVATVPEVDWTATPSQGA